MASLSVKTASVILFPGQGSQYVGMVGKELTNKGRSLFEMASQVLGYDLLSICRHGPDTELNKTVHSQPAIFVSSLAAVEKLAELSLGAVEKCKATAGFSVGEFAALVFAQSIDFVDALKLLKLRAEVTQSLSEEVPSGMMTVLGARGQKIEHACELATRYLTRTGVDPDEAVCHITNYLFPHGKVVGGHEKALEFLEHNGKDFGIKRMKRLEVSGAFHTQLMKPAGQHLHKALRNIEVKTPKIEVYSNLTGVPYTSGDEIKSALVKHVYRPVKWEQSLRNIYATLKDGDTYPVTFECGPQNNMTTILGMVDLKAKKLAYNIDIAQ